MWEKAFKEMYKHHINMYTHHTHTHKKKKKQTKKALITVFSTVPDIPAECSPSGYNELNEANRYWTYNDGSVYCDKDTITSNQWYRFTGDAGTMMATYCIPQSTCNTGMTGWISGGHPETAFETVSRSACMHWRTSCCFKSYSVDIQNCSGFYVYKLQKPSCNERYCGVKGKLCDQIPVVFAALHCIFAALRTCLSYIFL